MHEHLSGAAVVLAAYLGRVAATDSTWAPYSVETTTTTLYPTCPSPVTIKDIHVVSVTATTTIFETIIYTHTTTATTSTTEVSILIQPVTETTIQPTTETSSITEIVVQLFTETETIPTTLIETTPTTLTETTPTTLTETTPTTLTETTPTTQSITLTATEKLQLYTSTTRLTSLRICPTRITNPTFAVEVPMPTQWTWGCPPGWICKPLQENCDFEAGVPDRDFYCAPNECVPAPTLPLPLPNWGDTIYGNSTPLNTPGLGVTALDDYFNMAPGDFGFGYEIFVVDKVTTITSTFVVPPAATGVPAPPVFKARQQQINVPGPCYTWCNNPMLEVQALGKTPALCQPSSAFLASLSQCKACIDFHALDDLSETDTFLPIAPQFQQFLDYCAGYTTTTVNGQPTAIQTSVGSEPTVMVPTTVTLDVIGTSISGLAPTPAETITGDAVEQLLIIMQRGGSTTTLSSDDLEGATLILAAKGASQTQVITTGSSTYTTEVPATETSLGDQTSSIRVTEDSGTESPSATGSSAPVASGNFADRSGGASGLKSWLLPLLIALI